MTVQELKNIFPQNENLAPIALKWILNHDAVSTIIPGASRAEQVSANIDALSIPELSSQQVAEINEVYSKYIKKSVHQLW